MDKHRFNLAYIVLGFIISIGLTVSVLGLYLPAGKVTNKQLAAVLGNQDYVKVAEQWLSQKAAESGVTVTRMVPIKSTVSKDGNSVKLVIRLYTLQFGVMNAEMVLSKSVYTVISLSTS